MRVPDLRTRDSHARERMDDPSCDPVLLQRTYAQFRVVNAMVAGWHRTYRSHLRPLFRRGRTHTLLDIGSGGGDIARALARWARRDGFDLRVTAVDPDARAHAWAVRQPHVPGVEYRRAFSTELVEEGLSFDVVISNHLLHHLDEGEFEALLRDSEALAGRRAVHSDIHRSALAYALFSAGTWPFFRGSYIRVDGLTSIRRSYTSAELQGAVPGWRVKRQAPWRNLLIHDAQETRSP